MNSASRYLIVYLLPLALLASCARVGTPTGGPEDETPPMLLKSIPADGTTGFNGNTILLTFDERIVTNSLETDFILTPKPSGTFRARVNKNVLSLSFTEPFNENTTYSLSFGNTIQDITNDNPADGINLSFSTGDYIDSLSIQGQVLNLYSQEPIENLLVSLYSEQDSLDILSGPASYYSRTDSAGIYKFRNLPNGNFRVYAVRDKNKNSQADSDKEAYGFYGDTLVLANAINDINFSVQNLNTDNIRTVSARGFGVYFDLAFNKAISNFEMLEDEDLIYDQPESKTIRFYRMDRPYSDTTQVIYSVKDSIGTVYRDTVGVYFNESKLDPLPFSFQLTPSGEFIAPNDSLKITFNKPVISVNIDSLSIQVDSLNTIPLKENFISWNKLNTELSYPLDLVSLLNQTSSKTISIALRTGAFISADGDSSIVQTKNLSLLTTEDSAIIGGTVQSNSANIIVQLLDARTLKVVRSSTSKNFLFPYLPAGRYMIRIVKDLNNNGKWDTGNILKWEDPEPVKFYFDEFYKTKVIEVRKNWEQTDANIFF